MHQANIPPAHLEEGAIRGPSVTLPNRGWDVRGANISQLADRTNTEQGWHAWQRQVQGR